MTNEGRGASDMGGKVTAIIGAGPAGLTAAYELGKQGRRVVVLEADGERVGGISRTVDYRGFLFDIGGHRFFSKSEAINELWDEILPEGDWLECRRSSRILYRGQFFAYPLRARDALWKLGIWEALMCMGSYLKARMLPVREPRNFEEWVSNKFGRRLFRSFFQTYTEKVWGTSCREISADWAAQRIKGLNLSSAVMAALFPGRKSVSGDGVAKTLISSFRYPRRGPGMLWQRCRQRVEELGGEMRMGWRVSRCAFDRQSGEWELGIRDADGREESVRAGQVISSAPVRELVPMLEPALSAEALRSAAALKYRDFIVVAVILKDRGRLKDHWIYVHDPAVKVGRIQNFKAWSPEMVPDPELACYGMEYFCFADRDELWAMSDGDLGELAIGELAQLGLAEREEVADFRVVRQAKAYPVYDDVYAGHVSSLRSELEERFPTLHLAGRNGMHKYNNQDHSMMTAMLCAKNIIAGRREFDPWRVNEDAEYHEK